MNKKVIEECVGASVTGSVKFPEIVGKLINEKVESYHVDLVRSENRYYNAQGESIVLGNGVKTSPPAEKFSATTVAASVKSSQAGQIKYQQFMDQIAAAGCVYYIAYLKGKRVVYLGREGDAHTEYFPGSKP